ncbi:enoyl-CoA hydratase/isomerase family protein [Sneathiella sp.]|uniref:enoyl-CoA hydratase/isomerase family protein n=1 Tax=Sneathiella sp. TaxID=1964365 RepID=UPI00262BBBE8|nr:enoyl-CoA hydratase/isomerase family protein [Sneathiella sp.]MDF2368514.1 enoyl-CoA hydratase/isomerase family protein [Sneathiella sp.]
MIESHVEDGRLQITINQPAKHNAINRAMWRQLAEILAGVGDRPEIKLLVLRGAGSKAFCSGGDISEYEDFYKHVKDADEAYVGVRDVSALLRNLPIPTIAAISGHCVGAGVVIAAACDFRLCTKSSRFAVTAVKRGLVYPAPASGELLALVGLAVTRAILLRGRPLYAEDALKAGLVDILVEDSEFETGLAAFVKEMINQSSSAYTLVKKSISYATQLVEENEAMRQMNLDALGSEEFKLSTRNFMGKD